MILAGDLASDLASASARLAPFAHEGAVTGVPRLAWHALLAEPGA